MSQSGKHSPYNTYDTRYNAQNMPYDTYNRLYNNYSTPYWWWADIANSLDFVQEQKCSEDSSAIRPRSDWQSNIKDAFGFFEGKHGVSPVQVPDTPVEEVVKTLKTIYNARS